MRNEWKALLKWGDKSPRARRHRMFLGACALVLLLSLIYVVFWYANRARVEDESLKYREMYSPAPIVEVTPSPSQTPMPPASPTPRPTASPTPSAEPTPSATAPGMPPAPDVALKPLATPDEGTLVLALPTNPPVQENFSELLLYNPDTVGFLTVGDEISLPVVHRENDNDYYLAHSFAGKESKEGALFLDGANRLNDPNLIVYGHNMRDGTMFGRLSMYGGAEFLKEHAVVRFDTIYENAAYVPFAMFAASMDEDSGSYFDVRQIVLDETSFELFILKLRNRSARDVPVDVTYGDQLLTLVTCSSAEEDGRYIVALRRLRPGETEEDVRALVAKAS